MRGKLRAGGSERGRLRREAVSRGRRMWVESRESAGGYWLNYILCTRTSRHGDLGIEMRTPSLRADMHGNSRIHTHAHTHKDK